MKPMQALLNLRQAVVDWPAAQFDYRLNPLGISPVPCGCVALISRATELVTSAANYDTAFGLTGEEWSYIAGFGEEPAFDPTVKDYRVMTAEEATGMIGKREAIRRIDRVLGRHGVTL